MKKCQSRLEKSIQNLENGNNLKELENKELQLDYEEKTTNILDNKLIMDSLDYYKFANDDEKKEQMINISKIFLTDRHIGQINNLVIYENLEELYLQRNYINIIENLEFSNKIVILSLNFNYIKKIEGLKSLKCLKILDLSENLIDSFDLKEIPQNVEFLYLYENPFFEHIDLLNYRYDCINYFDHLVILDSLEISDREKLLFYGRKSYEKHKLIFTKKLQFIKFHYEYFLFFNLE